MDSIAIVRLTEKGFLSEVSRMDERDFRTDIWAIQLRARLNALMSFFVRVIHTKMVFQLPIGCEWEFFFFFLLNMQILG